MRRRRIHFVRNAFPVVCLAGCPFGRPLTRGNVRLSMRESACESVFKSFTSQELLDLF